MAGGYAEAGKLFDRLAELEPNYEAPFARFQSTVERLYRKISQGQPLDTNAGWAINGGFPPEGN